MYKYKWKLTTNGYICTRLKDTKQSISIHRLVLDVLEEDKTILVDHINGDKVDCRKANLRIANKSQNGKNAKIKSNNTTGVTGIYLTKNKTYQASMIFNNKNNELEKRKISKTFKRFDDAVVYRIQLEAKYSKEYSNNYNMNTNTIKIKYKSLDDNIETMIECSLDGDIINFEKLTK